MLPPLYRLAGIVSRPILGGVYRLRATGREQVPDGGFVLAANHTSNFDAIALGLQFYPRRQLRFMAKSELFNPFTGPFVKRLGAFPVRRGQADRAAIERGIELVRAGEIVVMFPEGTRREKGIVKKFEQRAHSGAARIAIGADAPLVPAGIVGTDRISRLGQIRVAFGPPVELDDLRGLELKEASRVATERLMSAIAELKQSLA